VDTRDGVLSEFRVHLMVGSLEHPSNSQSSSTPPIPQHALAWPAQRMRLLKKYAMGDKIASEKRGGGIGVERHHRIRGS